MFKKSLRNLLLYFISAFVILNTAKAQVCGGSWTSSFLLSYDCVSGQYIGIGNPGQEPGGCPVTPVYTATQTNTFIFNTPVSGFSVDFNAFSSAAGCARLEIKINGIFYHLLPANILPLTAHSGSCTGENVMIVSSDGYLISDATSLLSTNGQGIITINGVNASSVTLSTNDGAGSVFSDPYNCISVVPLKLKTFDGTSIPGCKAMLNWTTETESNIKNIEVERSNNGAEFTKVSEVKPRGSNSSYKLQIDNFLYDYFRLKINDIDGNFMYSKTIRLHSDCNEQVYQVTPNPAGNIISVSGLTNNDLVLIFDMMGRKVRTFTSLSNNKEIDIRQLTPGVYNVQVINAGKIKANIKIVKN